MRKIAVFASLLAAPAYTTQEPGARKSERQDERCIRLQRFFEANRCPLSRFAVDFVQEADANGLDWRLLPSITFVESSGGKFYLNNNVFGWNSCRTRFRSVRAGIHVVAEQLGKSELYRGKGTDGKLRTYNPRPEYAFQVKSVMRRLAAGRPPALVSANLQLPSIRWTPR